MICFDEKHAQILLILRSFCCSLLDVINSILLLNSFITRGTINYLQIKEGQENFYDVNSLGANHPFLIFLDFMVVSSRICINYLYKSLVRRYKYFALPEHVPIDLTYIEYTVTTVQIISYDGFIEMFDNITPDEFNDSFKVVTNNEIEDSSSEDEQ